MQDALVQRYLGNKNSISQQIVEIVDSVAVKGDLIFDAFSGSLATSAAFRHAGYEVACNDVNHFSWLYARAYFSTKVLPWPKFHGEKRNPKESKEQAWARLCQTLTQTNLSDIPRQHRRRDIFNHYCEEGAKSAFTSSRGQSGRRRFFSKENANAIDRALTRIRFWHQSGIIDEITRCLLTASLISAVEKVSNTQGTYHDFPRDFVDPRAFNPIRIKPPLRSQFGMTPSRFVGKSLDSLEFCKTLPRHQVLYLDPPYNFRQYTAYYFMLNLLSEYAEIEDLDVYFSDIRYVRGQNMRSDFKSSFCSRQRFLPSLRAIISNSNCNYVVMSYFDGRNHWGKFKDDASETLGQKSLREFFSSDLFVPDSATCIPLARTNYQSYGGYTAKSINELLFVAQKANQSTLSVMSDCSAEGSRWIGSAAA